MSRSSTRKAPTPAPAPVSAGTDKAYVPVASSTSTYRVPFNPSGTAVTSLTQGTVCEFLTTTDTTIGGSVQTAVAAPYRGTTSTPGAVATSQYARTAAASETAAANNLLLTGLVARPDGKYYAAYVHSGASVSIGGVTVVNPNTAVDVEAAPGERSSQIVLVRYNSDHTVDYVFTRLSGGVRYGIAGNGVGAPVGRIDRQTEVQLAYFAGTPNKVYLVGNFKGFLNFGNSKSISSEAGAATYDIEEIIPFAAAFDEDESGVLTCDWAATVSEVSTASAGTLTSYAPVYSGASGCDVDAIGNLYFMVSTRLTITVGAAINLNQTIYVDPVGGGSSASVSASQLGLVDADTGAYDTTQVYTLKLQGDSGTLNTSFSGARKGVFAANGASTTNSGVTQVQTPLAIKCVNAEAFTGVATLYHSARIIAGSPDVVSADTTVFYFVNSTSGTAISGGDGVSPFTGMGRTAYSGQLCVDLTNRLINGVVCVGGTNMRIFAYQYVASSGAVTAAGSAGASGAASVNLLGSSGTQNLRIRGLTTNSVSGTPTLTIAADFASAQVAIIQKGTQVDALTDSAYTFPTTSGTSEQNSVLISATAPPATGTSDDYFFAPVSVIAFDQSSAAVVGNNEVRGVCVSGGNRLVVGLGYFSELSYVNQVGATVTLPALVSSSTFPSTSLTRASTNALVGVLLSTTEGEDRLFLLLDSLVAGTGASAGKYDANVVPLLPGQIFRFSTSRLTPGQNYYISVADGSLTITKGSNKHIGFAVTATDLLIAGGPLDA